MWVHLRLFTVVSPLSAFGLSRLRSLEALQSYQRCGGTFSGDEDVFALAEVVRGLARCGRQTQVKVKVPICADATIDLRVETKAGPGGRAAPLVGPLRTVLKSGETVDLYSHAGVFLFFVVLAFAAAGHWLTASDV